MDIEFASSRMEKDLSNRRRIAKQYGHIQTSLENRLSDFGPPTAWETSRLSLPQDATS